MADEGNYKRKALKVLLWISIPTLLGFIGVGTYAAVLANEAKDIIEESQYELEAREVSDKSDLRKSTIDPRVDNISILFLGIDDSENGVYDQTRTDAMILATFNKNDKSVKLVSIPRDTRVELVGRGVMDKAGHAHAYGGVDLAVKSIEALFKLPIDYYVRLNFNAFVEIVDTLGGIEVAVPFEIHEQDSERNLDAVHIKEGLQTLDGEKALAYARTRKYDNDIERGKRQQEILEAVINKGASIQSIGKYNEVLHDVGDNLTTNMPFDAMVAFHDYVYKASAIDVEMLTIRGRDVRVNHLYYYLLNPDSVREISTILKAHLEL